MLCDACLMRLYRGFRADETAKKVFFALQADDFPTLEVLMRVSGVSRHGVREALSFFRGAGLVWGEGCAGLSEGGRRLLELLRDGEQPEPSAALCDDCLLEIGQGLSGDEYRVLARLSDRAVHSRHDLLIGTGLTLARLRDVLRALEGAGLIQSGRGRVFRLAEAGRRLERLLRRKGVKREA